MNKLFEEVPLRGKKIRNRIVMPPMVNFNWSGKDGFIVDKHIEHYEKRARGGAGLIIVEATAVSQEGRLRPTQLGIWSDKHTEGLNKITNACHRHGAVILLQIHHGGLNSHPEVSEKLLGPSADHEKPNSYSMSLKEIMQTAENFINAAARAEKAGFDGVELHGAHLFLLNQFASLAINKREDEYGISVGGRMKLARDIIAGIRAKTSKDFLISYRMGSNAPVLADGIRIAMELEKYQIDLLHVSHGGYSNIPDVPVTFDYNWIVYGGTEIKKKVNIPVIVVNEIKTPERASFLIENNLADFVAIGRDMLTDPEWAAKAMKEESINYCQNCKPRCKRYEGDELCPRIKY